MKKTTIIIIIATLLIGQSCVTEKNKYKETDIFEDFETQQGFVVLHLPPVLFKLVFNLSENNTQINSDLTEKINVIKVMFFEENANTISKSEVNQSIQQKVKKLDYKLLTKITQEKSDISIYIIEHNEVIREVLLTTLSEKEYLGVNVVGKFTKEEVLNVYRSINMQQIKSMSN